MLDLDQIKQGEQGAWDWRERLPKGRSGPASRLRPHQPRRGRERDAVCFRFAADNSETSRGRGPNGLDLLASHQLERISINLALPLRGAPSATKPSRPIERSAARDCSPRAKPAGRNDDWSE
jgi:hypothetical protein